MPDPTEQLADWKAKTDALESWAAGDPEFARDPLFEDIADAQYKLLAAVESVLGLHTRKDMRGIEYCSRCRVGEYAVPWPCAEVRAITEALGGEW